MRSSRLAAALSILLLAGCQTDIGAPSLAPRPVERQPILAPDDAAEPVTAVDPALATRLAAIDAAAQAGVARFDARRAEAEGAVSRAAGATAGSERWLDAQQALSALEAARAEVTAQLTAIEELRGQPANAARANREAIDAVATRLSATDQAQSDTSRTLAVRLP